MSPIALLLFARWAYSCGRTHEASPDLQQHCEQQRGDQGRASHSLCEKSYTAVYVYSVGL
jgi:hypothetical protein